MDVIRRQSSARKNQAGFTLLEVMVSVSIIALVLVALLTLQGRTIRMNDIQQNMTRATLLAQMKMSELEQGAGAATLGSLENEGSFPGQPGHFRWQVSTAGTPLANVTEVTVDVTWGEAGPRETVSLVSYMRNDE